MFPPPALAALPEWSLEHRAGDPPGEVNLDLRELEQSKPAALTEGSFLLQELCRLVSCAHSEKRPSGFTILIGEEEKGPQL